MVEESVLYAEAVQVRPLPPGQGVIGDSVEIVKRRDKVCPRCSDGRPICTDRKPDGARYTHGETCATYDWADDVCAKCEIAMGDA